MATVEAQLEKIPSVVNASAVVVVTPGVATPASHIVDFDGPDDPHDPLNWSPWRKWSLVIIISVLSLIVNLAILMCAPATSYILREFNSTNKLESTLLISIWELGEVLGPLVIAPMAELYGRLPVYHAANILFIVFSIAAANSTSMAMLITIRFFLGLCVASTVINPAIVGDMFREHNRGRALGIMGMTPFIAPVLGPTIGGFISEAKGWRWTFWLIAIIATPFQILFLAIYRESYRVKILKKKTRRLQKETNNPELRSIYQKDTSPGKTYQKDVSAGRALRDAAIRPLQLLFFSPLVLLVGISGAFGMSLVYIIITSLSPIYDEIYHFRKGHIGLSYLGLGVGMITSIISCSHFIDYYLQRQTQRGRGRPENRLPPMALGSILVPIGLITFGWTVQAHLHWIVPIIVSVFVGFGFVAITIASWSYLVDAFDIHAASATAGATVLRNAASALLPLAGPALTAKMGYGWGYTTLALIALLAAPIPLFLIKKGSEMRKRTVADPPIHSQGSRTEMVESGPMQV